MQKKKQKNLMVFPGNQTKAKEPDNDIEYDCEIDRDSENHNKPYSGDGGGGSKTRACASEESLPVDIAPLEAGAAEAADSHPICYPPEVRAYVDKLFAQYRTKRPSNADYDRAITYACRPAYDDNGERYPVLDDEKSRLLEYAFEQGTENGNTSWRYISGVYKRFASAVLKPWKMPIVMNGASHRTDTGTFSQSFLRGVTNNAGFKQIHERRSGRKAGAGHDGSGR